MPNATLEPVGGREDRTRERVTPIIRGVTAAKGLAGGQAANESRRRADP